MSKTSLITTIAIVIIVGGLYYFYAPDSWKFWRQTASVIDSSGNISRGEPQHETITAKHQYKNGTHIVAGEVNSPTACDIVTVTARVAESMPEQVTLNFVSKTNGEMCAQVVTANRFKVNFTASENATIKATWNGKLVKLNLIPAGPNEDLLNFELFIKG